MNRFVLAATAALVATATQAQDAGVTEEMLVGDTDSVGDVLTNGMGRHLQRFSPLDTLNKENVDNLVPAWAFSLGGENNGVRRRSPSCMTGSCISPARIRGSTPST